MNYHLNIKEIRKLSETEFELEVTYTFTTSVKLPKLLMEKLERIAKEQKVTKSDLIRGWIHSFLALNPAEQDVIVSTYGKVSLDGGVKVLGIRLVDEVLNELDEIARRNNVSRSDIIRSIMVFKIEGYEKAK
ncbi:ribbon-helix-helix protein, CopG family [Saccharolobus islandicus]|uniref:CopG domain protein DNA-binding domain protein n=1 Tax=Saccharolobus islandicus (strain L.D.8.5 / Lassen \|nr:ribbon-helix-helix protein, CopG family [Sulfolobus islandicus]ADB87818.1 CopG domain protein DNA-binding domain protein [Sulfolobus islandicus L.D.8.5]